MSISKYIMLPINTFSVIKQLARMEKIRKNIDKLRKTASPAEVRSYIGNYSSTLMKQVAKDFKLNISVIDRDKVPENEGCVFISNHQGYLDVVAILYALGNKQSGFLGKSELRKVPFVGKWIESVGGYFIERGNARSSLKVFKESWKHLKDGDSMVIFPEGTRSQGPHLNEYKAGAFKLATGGNTGAPLVPIVVDGAYHWFEEQGYLRTGEDIVVTVQFLDPISIDDLSREEIKKLPKTIQDMTKSTLDHIHILRRK